MEMAIKPHFSDGTASTVCAPDFASQNGELFDFQQWVLNAGEMLSSKFEQNFNLILVETGKVLLETPHGEQAVEAGSLIVFEQVHFVATNIHPGNDAVVLALSFSQNMMQRFKQRYAEALIKTQNDSVLNRDTLPLTFNGCDLTRMAMTALSQLLKSDTDVGLLALKLEELVLLQLTDEKGGMLAKQLMSACDPATERFREFVENNYLNEWSLEKFAKEYAVSLTAFKTMFNQVYGCSPRAWINEKRLRYAYELLSTNSMRIIDVSMTSGFSSQSYFTQAFKARFGITPTKVRQA